MENRIDELFPNRGLPKPFPWLKITGGLNLFKFNVTHTVISYDSLYVHISFTPPLIENDKLEEISTYRFFSVSDLEKLVDPREPILNLIRQIAEHEILESLRVKENNGNGFQPYYDEIHVWHNLEGREKLEQRLPTDPIMCKKLYAEVEPLIQYFE